MATIPQPHPHQLFVADDCNADEALATVKAENDLLRRKCASLERQVRAGPAFDASMDADSLVMYGLCDMVGGDDSFSNMSLDDAGFVLNKVFEDGAGASLAAPAASGMPPASPVGSVSTRPCSPIPAIPRQASASSSLASLDPLFSDHDASMCPELHEADLSEEDFFDSITVPILGRSVSSSWQAQGLGTPRSSGLAMTAAGAGTPAAGATPAPAAVRSDENVDCNAAAAATPPPSKKRRACLGGEHCPDLSSFTMNGVLDDLDFLEVDFLGGEGDLSSAAAAKSAASLAPPASDPETARASPPRSVETAWKPASAKVLPLPPPPVETASTSAARRQTPQVMSNFDADGKLVPLTEEQAAKQRNWVNKRKRVKYGTKYVYTTKQNIARARKRKDGKFEPRRPDTAKASAAVKTSKRRRK